MKRKILLTLLLLLVLISFQTPSAMAYGGGMTPPGYFDSAFIKRELVCTYNTREISSRFITFSFKLPTCRLVEVELEPKEFNTLLNDFINKLRDRGDQ